MRGKEPTHLCMCSAQRDRARRAKLEGGWAATEAAAGSFIVCGPSGPENGRSGVHARPVLCMKHEPHGQGAGGRERGLAAASAGTVAASRSGRPRLLQRGSSSRWPPGEWRRSCLARWRRQFRDSWLH